MFKSTHFILQEFVPKSIYDRFGANSIWFINPAIVVVSDFIRDKLGKPVTINDWHEGGQYDYSGFREPDCKIGAFLSAHKRGEAADWKVHETEPDQVRQFIRDNFAELNKLGLTTIEKDTPTWTHGDCRWTGLTTLLEVPYQ